MALDKGTKVRITGNSKVGSHGFEIGEIVSLVGYDSDGDPRFTNGKRTWWVNEKHYSVTSLIDKEDVKDRLAAAYDQLSDANREVQSISLLLLAQAAREQWPDATAIILHDSDQGTYEDLHAVEVDGEEIAGGIDDEEWDGFFDNNVEYAWNLDSQGAWTIFGDPDYSARWMYRLLIDPILEYEGDYIRRAGDLAREKENA